MLNEWMTDDGRHIATTGNDETMRRDARATRRRKTRGAARVRDAVVAACAMVRTTRTMGPNDASYLESDATRRRTIRTGRRATTKGKTDESAAVGRRREWRARGKGSGRRGRCCRCEARIRAGRGVGVETPRWNRETRMKDATDARAAV